MIITLVDKTEEIVESSIKKVHVKIFDCTLLNTSVDNIHALSWYNENGEADMKGMVGFTILSGIF